MLNLNLETLILSKTIIFVIYNLDKEAKKLWGFYQCWVIFGHSLFFGHT